MINLTSAALPHGPCWAIEETLGRALWQTLLNTDAAVHAKEFEAEKAAHEALAWDGDDNSSEKP